MFLPLFASSIALKVSLLTSDSEMENTPVDFIKSTIFFAITLRASYFNVIVAIEISFMISANIQIFLNLEE